MKVYIVEVIDTYDYYGRYETHSVWSTYDAANLVATRINVGKQYRARVAEWEADREED